MNNISIKKAAIINLLSKYSNIIIQLIINAILARLLSPEEYGVVAVITVFISFFNIIADMGIGPAIIQDKTLKKNEISDIFIFTFFTAIVISIGFIIFSVPLSMFYNNSVYIKLGGILSIGIFFNVLNIVPNSILLKEKEFKKIGIRTIVISIITGLITILLALNGFSYYSLVINSSLIALFTFIINIFTVKIKIYFKFSTNGIKRIRKFSTYQFAFNFINYFSRNLDNLTIGKVLGQTQLAFYDKAYTLMLYPIQNLTNVITPVLHPILSEYQDQKDIIYNKYLKVIKLLSLLGVFVSIFCFFSANEIIYIMFGAQWGGAIKCFRILSISIFFQMVLSSTGAIFQASNKTKELFVAGLLGSFSNITGIIMGIILGSIESVAVGVTIAYIINFMSGFYLLINKVFNKSLFKFIYEFKSCLFICIFLVVSMKVFNFNIENNLLSVLYKGIICTISYIISLFITGELKFIKNIIRL